MILLAFVAVLIAPFQLPPLPLPPPIPPIPPLPCLPPLVCPPLPPIPPLPPLPPSPRDDPPQLSALRTDRRIPKRVTLAWNARDDEGLVGFRLYVNGHFVAKRGPRAHQVSFPLRCGRTYFRVEAVDSALQRTSRSATITRRC